MIFQKIMKNQYCVLFCSVSILLWLISCSQTYYSAMEKVGIYKRDIMVDRVEDARDAQTDAQIQFKSALEQFNSMVKLQETDLKIAYDKLSREYDRSAEAAHEVSGSIDKVESVAEDLFNEWEKELKEYQNPDLRRSSADKLKNTMKRYKDMLISMHRAEASMSPVLKVFHDNVLFLKHNLNAQAIGSLHGEFAGLKGQIDTLIKEMNAAIALSNTFIADIK